MVCHSGALPLYAGIIGEGPCCCKCCNMLNSNKKQDSLSSVARSLHGDSTGNNPLKMGKRGEINVIQEEDDALRYGQINGKTC